MTLQTVVIFVMLFIASIAFGKTSYKTSYEGQIAVAALEHKLDPKLVSAIVAVESRGRANAHNKRTHDYGLMQVNIRNAGNLKTEQLFDVRTNLRLGCSLLAKTKRVCEYNLGKRGARKNPKTCLAYETKVTKERQK